MVPQIRFTRGPYFGASWFTHSLRPARLLAPLCTDLTGLPAIGGFYFQASDGSVTLPAAGYDYSIDWTPMLAGLSPPGMGASLAAPDPRWPWPPDKTGNAVSRPSRWPDGALLCRRPFRSRWGHQLRDEEAPRLVRRPAHRDPWHSVARYRCWVEGWRSGLLS